MLQGERSFLGKNNEKRTLNTTRAALFLSVFCVLGVLVNPREAIAVTLPVELFSDQLVPRDDPDKDDSKIAIVFLDEVLLNQVSANGRLIDSLDNPSPVELKKTVTFSQTIGYTKSISNKLSSEISSELSIKYIIGAKIGAKIGASVQIGEEFSKLDSREDKIEYCARVCCA